jgi:superfamily II DNA or RNA helicase
MNSEDNVAFIDDHTQIHFVTTYSTYFAEVLAPTELRYFSPLAINRSPLLLTERTVHLQIIGDLLTGKVKNIVILKGGMSKKQRDSVEEQLKNIDKDEERIILATGRYIGEGFDDARPDTLFLALPISWKGTIQQYAGRLHRQYDGKKEVRIYDYLDESVPMLARMYKRRLSGYKSIGYEITDQENAT